jgi:dolichol-phosphate mannosyltransferase
MNPGLRSSMPIHPPSVRSSVVPTGTLKVPKRAAASRRSAQSLLLSLVVPTYNEAVNIQPLLQRIRDLLDPLLGSRYEVIVMDDDSPDETWKVAAAMKDDYPQLVVFRREHERGLSSAVVRGWQVAGGDILGTINADFQHPPEFLLEMLKLVQTADLVVATRMGGLGSFGEMPRVRQFLSRGASKIGRVLAPKIFGRVSDPLSGYYLLRREAIEEIELRPNGFKTLIEILARGRVMTIAECGYAMQKRRGGESKAKFRQWLEYLVQLQRLRAQAGARRN